MSDSTNDSTHGHADGTRDATPPDAGGDPTANAVPGGPVTADPGAAAPASQPTTTLPPQPPLVTATPSTDAGATTDGAPASADAGATPLLRRTWVKVTGAAVAAVLLLGVGFGTGWAASSAGSSAAGPAGWNQGGNAPAWPDDGADEHERPGPGDRHDGGPGGAPGQDDDSDGS
ncbi:hypothetical protein ACI3KY_03360 [Microbacterium sp. ZW T2_14]|uniref:hypothetical protein n=1 Tax=Microbacterium sp. ZW T2_14 TaxID=3378079 RepID=UPI003852C36F